ncbi:MAG: HPr family phosphocarrier protein [Planctomycetes bacterium]|nr:HPr family phosphocarrier protein [Planctomycetota bacterium]
MRWLALVGVSITHLESRLESYGLPAVLGTSDVALVNASFVSTKRRLATWLARLFQSQRSELERLGLTWLDKRLPDEGLAPVRTRLRLPRNVGQEEITDESLRIAEVASKYLASCGMFEAIGVQRITDPQTRHTRLRATCKEEQARVYEATVHNLQSMYDTYIKNTVTEGRDERLPRLRGHLSAALHLLESVTFLSHFVERYELDARTGGAAAECIAKLVSRADAEDLILNELLFWANELLQRGRATAEELLTAYINLQELRVELPDNLRLHARPAALIVNIVGRYGTPVDMEVAGHRCNAGSILELLVAVGSNPDARSYVFRGDIHPLRDIAALFESSLGEDGLENLPDALHYLRSS